VRLSRDNATDVFLRRADSTAKMSRTRTRLHRLLRKFFSDFDVNGLLDAYPLHLFSTAQLQQLLRGAGAPPSFEKALDIGAGVGLVTDELRPLCSNVLTTETSRGMARRLRNAGYECWEEDIAETVGGRVQSHRAGPPRNYAEVTQTPRTEHEGTFELVSILNVIDRSRQPAGLLRAAHRLLDPERGWLLLATPLPYRPFYYEGARTYAPVAEESLALPRARQWKPSEADTAAEEEWALGAERLLNRVLPSQGFQVVAFSRLPYISAGDADDDLAYLDDVMLLARPIAVTDGRSKCD
jgi:2-polyprenyl-3-methyl-5-hydroxy-6-metoxy-1,4-benzoquinol methylase